MNHSFMSDVANELESLDIGTLRYQFPYVQRGSKRTDPPELCHATVRAAAAEASRLAPGIALFAGGKSFGGRMTSQARALGALQDVKGLVFFGFPLHPAGKPADSRGKHLVDVNVPMLFLQGTRDELASLDLFEPLMRDLGSRATVHLIDDADHSFHVRARTGRKDPEVRSEMLQVVASWMKSIVGSSPNPHPPLRSRPLPQER